MDLSTFNNVFEKLRVFYQQNTFSGVITLGDFVGHDVSLKQRKSIQQYLNEKFSGLGAPIYFGFGNNDSLFGNYQAYEKDNISSYTLLKNSFPNLVTGFVYDESLSKCASISETDTCLYHENKNLGHYSVQLQQKLRLINMNTIVFNGESFFNDQTKAVGALNWLQEELHDAVSKKDSVVIAKHVPPGIDLYSGHFHFREKWLKLNTFQKPFMAIIHNALDNDLNLIAHVTHAVLQSIEK